MGYKILGFAVWKGAKAYLRWRVGALVSRRGVAVGIVVLGIGVAAVAGSRRAEG
ncbi:MAG TPA: hypothetical protein VFT50_16995 [Baekduia sp.]|nr:hypothetical protein [Baekduia sp.]